MRHVIDLDKMYKDVDFLNAPKCNLSSHKQVINIIKDVQRKKESISAYSERAKGNMPEISLWLEAQGLQNIPVIYNRDNDLNDVWDKSIVKVNPETGEFTIVENVENNRVKKTKFSPTQIEVSDVFGHNPDDIYIQKLNDGDSELISMADTVQTIEAKIEGIKKDIKGSREDMNKYSHAKAIAMKEAEVTAVREGTLERYRLLEDELNSLPLILKKDKAIQRITPLFKKFNKETPSKNIKAYALWFISKSENKIHSQKLQDLDTTVKDTEAIKSMRELIVKIIAEINSISDATLRKSLLDRIKEKKKKSFD